MFFVDQEHENSFRALIDKFGKARDKEYLAAYYVLNADDELRKKAAIYIERHGIHWEAIWGREAIWEQDWSSGYRLLLQLAEHLFRGVGEVDLAYGLRTWDNNLFQVAMQAIFLRRNGLT